MVTGSDHPYHDGCQPYQKGEEQLLKITQKAKVVVQKAENIWGH